jgi:threonine aldolase
MRQVGIIAAGGLYALKNNIGRLTEDHAKAKQLGKFLYELENAELNPDDVETNIIVFRPKSMDVPELLAACKKDGLLLSVGSPGYVRIVTHMDVSFDEINHAQRILTKYLG